MVILSRAVFTRLFDRGRLSGSGVIRSVEGTDVTGAVDANDRVSVVKLETGNQCPVTNPLETLPGGSLTPEQRCRIPKRPWPR